MKSPVEQIRQSNIDPAFAAAGAAAALLAAGLAAGIAGEVESIASSNHSIHGSHEMNKATDSYIEGDRSSEIAHHHKQVSFDKQGKAEQARADKLISFAGYLGGTGLAAAGASTAMYAVRRKRY